MKKNFNKETFFEGKINALPIFVNFLELKKSKTNILRSKNVNELNTSSYTLNSYHKLIHPILL